MFFDRGVMGLRPTQGDEKRLGPATTRYGTVALPFVIPTERRSGGICGSADLSWKCFSTELSWAFGPPKVMKNEESGRLALAWNGEGRLRSGCIETVTEFGLGSAF